MSKFAKSDRASGEMSNPTSPGCARLARAARAMKRPVAVLLVASQLAGCATEGRQGPASEPGPESQRSAAGTIASAAGGGALFGVLLTGEMMSDCHGDGCALGLLLGALLIPVGAVIGAGVGVAQVAIQSERDEAKERESEIRSGEGCPDGRAAEWLRECSAVQGSIPPAFSPSPDRWQSVPNPQHQAWFDECGAAFERKLDARKRRLVPEICRSEPVPTLKRVECLQKSAAAEQQERLDRAFFAAQRSRSQGQAPFGHCAL
jgi:hypothetical protein